DDDDRKGSGFRPYPMVVNAVDHKRLLLGWQSLYVSIDNGDNVSKLTTDAANPVSALAYGGMNADGSPAPDVIFQARPTQIKVSTENGKSWPTFFDLASVGATDKVTQITLDPENWRTAYATAGQKVFATRDGGATWADITGPATGAGALPSQDLNGVALFPVD